MALRNLSKRVSPAQVARFTHQQTRYAAVVPPVTQNATGKNGPTAMVFMNMGGPSTTGEVGDFLSRLFVCGFEFPIPRVSAHRSQQANICQRLTAT